MYRTVFRRLFHSDIALRAEKAEKSLLARLRSKTGYAISNCKKALVMHNDDYDKALAWLNEQAQKEGWKKAEKLQGRKTAQGLIGLLAEKNSATLVEVNCETDFVARNKDFRSLVSTIARVCHSHNIKCFPDSISESAKNVGNCETILAAPVKESNSQCKTLSDLIALKIGLLGENMSLRRVTSIKVAEQNFIGCYAHPATNEVGDKTDDVLFGKYGAVVAFKNIESESSTNIMEKECGKKLAQHVVGMKPQSVGQPFVPTTEAVNETEEPPLDKPAEEPLNKPEEAENESSEDYEIVAPKEDVRMLYQEFLSDPSVVVGDYVYRNGIEILDFDRFECGESLPTDQS